MNAPKGNKGMTLIIFSLRFRSCGRSNLLVKEEPMEGNDKIKRNGFATPATTTKSGSRIYSNDKKRKISRGFETFGRF
jgi:hypothetical protein